MLSVEERFWTKVQKTDSCWLWKAALRSQDSGYGAFRFQRQGKWTQANAHRIAWELTNGAIPEGHCVLHRCDTPRCVNPSHLFLGSNKENTQDMLAKGRHHAAKGSASGPAKLTEEDIPRIREYLRNGETPENIGKYFGVSRGAIHHIKKRATWGHVV